MVLRKIMGIFLITVIVGAASLAMAGVPDVTYCTAAREDTLFPGKMVVLVVPGGSAEHSLDVAVKVIAPYPAPQVLGDATIHLEVRDGAGDTIVNYPSEDMWLECPSDPLTENVGLICCTGGCTADFSTDIDGMTEFQDALSAGGQSFLQTYVVINGNALSNTIDVSWNSPDLDGNGVVNLVDLQAFTADFFDPVYHFRSDLYFDIDVNIIDLPEMAKFYGNHCP